MRKEKGKEERRRGEEWEGEGREREEKVEKRGAISWTLGGGKGR